jgi:hypothetical protein
MSITATDCARALFASWISRFEVAAIITSDRGAQFTSALWAALCNLLNISLSPATAYNPQSNGLVERFHRQLKDALQIRATAHGWCDHLPWVMLGVLATFHEDNDFSSAEAVFASSSTPPSRRRRPSWRSCRPTMAGCSPSPAHHNSSPAPTTLPKKLLLGCFVLVRCDAQPPLVPFYARPFRVLERSTHFFLLQIGDWTDKLPRSTSSLPVPRLTQSRHSRRAGGNSRAGAAKLPTATFQVQHRTAAVGEFLSTTS